MKKIISLIIACALLIQGLSAVFAADNTAEWDPFNGDKDVNIVFIGGSITQGEGYRKYMSDYLKEKYEPMVEGRKVNCINSGIGGTGSDYGSIRVKRDVISYNPDMVYVEFAVNDVNSGRDDTIRNMETIVRNLQSLPNPPMINFVYTTGTNFKTVSDIHSEVSKHYEIPEIDFKRFMEEEGIKPAESGTDYDNLPSDLKQYYSDLTHPNSAGGKYWADYAIKLIEKDPKKYFKHPKLNSVPLSKDFNDEYIFDYYSATDALDNGKAEISGVEGEDYVLSKSNGRVILKTVNASYSFTFKGKMLKIAYLQGTNTGKFKFVAGSKSTVVDTYGPYNLTTPGFSRDGFEPWDSTISIVLDGTKNDSSNGTDIELCGFFYEAEEILGYPIKYPEGVIINSGEKEEVKQEVVTLYAKETELAHRLGIFTDEMAENPNTEITRGNFAKMVSNIILPNRDENEEWYKEAFYEDNNDVVVEKEANAVNIFKDVEVNHVNFEDVKTVYEYNLMNGYSSDEFAPDETITALQAGVVLTKMLGYRSMAELNGGYPNGYMSVINKLGILDGIKGQNEPVTNAVFAKMLDNIYDTNLFGLTSIASGKAEFGLQEESFIVFYFKLDWVSGTMTQNVVTTLTEAVNSKVNNIKVGNNIFKLPDGLEYVNEFIGRDVKVYYSELDGESSVKAVYLTGKDEAITIKAEDVEDYIPDYASNKIQYTDNGKLKTESFEANSYVIYNGVAVSGYDENNFKFLKGDITLVKPKSASDYNTVIINDYRDWIVLENNMGKKELRRETDAEIVTDESAEFIDYSENTDTKVFILDSAGNYVSPQEIKKGDILNVARNGNAVKVLWSNKKVEGFSVTSVSSDDKAFPMVSNGTDNYVIKSVYETKNGFAKAVIGAAYNFSIDSFGYIVWSQQLVTAGKYHGMVMGISKVEDEEGTARVMFKILGFETGILTKYMSDEKVKITNNEGIKLTPKSQDTIYNAMHYYNNGAATADLCDGFVTYVLDGEGIVKSIDMARTIEDKTGNADVIYDVMKIQGFAECDGTEANQFNASLFAQKFTRGGEVIFFDKAVAAFMNAYGDDIRDYSVSNDYSKIFIQDKKFDILAYGSSYDTCTAEYIVRKSTVQEPRYNAREKVYLIKDIQQALYEDKVVDMISAYKLGRNGTITEEVFYTEVGDNENNGIPCSWADACPALSWFETDTKPEPDKQYKVEKGDVVAIFTDVSNTNEIKGLYMIYKDSLPVPGIDDAKTGWIAGAANRYIADKSEGVGNPYSVSDNDIYSNAINDGGYLTTVSKGYILSYNNGVIKYTTNDLSVKHDISEDNFVEKYIRRTYTTKGYACYLLDMEGKNPQISELSEGDIHPYSNYRSNASAIVTITTSGTDGVILVINKE